MTMEWTLGNIEGKVIQYANKSCCLISDPVGWQLQRWDDDTNYDTLSYAIRANVSVDILADIRKFLNCQKLLDCTVHERKVA